MQPVEIWEIRSNQQRLVDPCSAAVAGVKQCPVLAADEPDQLTAEVDAVEVSVVASVPYLLGKPTHAAVGRG